MILQYFIYTCGQCHKDFKAVELPQESYGEFLMRSSDGNYAYLLALDSNAYEEVSTIVNNCIQDADEYKRTQILQKIFGSVCDKSPAGKIYNIGTLPICTYCNSKKIVAWEPTYPPEYVEEYVRPVTFNYWFTLNKKEKIGLIESLIRELTFQ